MEGSVGCKAVEDIQSAMMILELLSSWLNCSADWMLTVGEAIVMVCESVRFCHKIQVAIVKLGWTKRKGRRLS